MGRPAVPAGRGWLAAACALVLPLAPGMAVLPQQGGNVDLLSQASVQIDGAAALDRAGTAAAAAGDVNGDGLGDVIVGAPGAGANGRSGSGSAFVVLGRGAGGSIDLASLGSGGFRIDGATPDSGAGAAVAAAGDVNGDGRGDLIVGAPGAANNGAGSGSASVVFGAASPASVDLASLGARGFRIDGAAAGHNLGTSVAGVGDLNADGRGDVLVGAPFASFGAPGSGSAYLVFGTASTATIDLASPPPGVRRIDGAGIGHAAGISVAGVGDIDGDGRGDVAVGAPGAGFNGRAGSGSGYVIFDPVSSALDLAALGTRGYRIDGGTAGDGAGGAVAGVGDVSDDGRPDVAVGANNASAPGRSASGLAYVVFGKPSTVAIDLQALGAAGFRMDGAAAGDAAGSLVAGLGDVSGDGGPDVLVGAPSASPGGRGSAGSAFAVFGRVQTSTVDLASAGFGFRMDGGQAGDTGGGGGGAAGDVNGDGRPDLIVGAPLASNRARGSSGSAYVVYGFGTPALSYDAIAGRVGQPIAPRAPRLVARTGQATFQAGGTLPAGLALDPSTGVISGTPTAPASAGAPIVMTDLAGTVQTIVPIAIEPEPPPQGVLRVTGTKLQARWRESRLSGAVVVSGNVDRPAAIRLTLARIGGTGRQGARRDVRRAGAFRLRVALRPNLQPGAYRLTATAAAGNVVFPTARSRVTLPAPAEGIIDRAAASGTRGGPAVLRLPGSRIRVWVRFHFSVLPKRGFPAIVWIDPKGRRTPPTVKPRAALIESAILQPEGIPKGRWRILVTVGRVVARRITVRIG